MKRRKELLFLVLILLVVSFSGCGLFSNEPEAVPDLTGETVTEQQNGNEEENNKSDMPLDQPDEENTAEDNEVSDEDFSGHSSDDNVDEAQKENARSKDSGSDESQPVKTPEPEKPKMMHVVNADKETKNITYGIDVSKYQGTINWEKVAASGVQFAIVRVGCRTLVDGRIIEDPNAKYNLQEAQANGIMLGAYFFSTAITEDEAIEEADWVADYISKYQITYPVVYNCEGFDEEGNRQHSLTKSARTKIAMAFLDEIYEQGYTPMFYAAKKELEYNNRWKTDELEGNYKIWVAHYSGIDDIYSDRPEYDGQCDMWQYTCDGKVDGIKKNVDINISYFGYKGVEDAKDEEAPEEAKADVEALMKFKNVDDTVTAKIQTNLRDIPSQGEDSTVVRVLTNPEAVHRTGKSNSGWSRIEIDGEIYYAVSSYLTTDLTPVKKDVPTEEQEEPEIEIKTIFTDCDDLVTPKEEVNLRTLPSVTDDRSDVVVTLRKGETVRRTGYNEQYGWSRVEYGEQTLYCVSSYVKVVE